MADLDELLLQWSFQVTKEPAPIVSMKNQSISDVGGRRSGGHASEKTDSSMSRKGSSLRSKEMSSQADGSLHSKKQAGRYAQLHLATVVLIAHICNGSSTCNPLIYSWQFHIKKFF